MLGVGAASSVHRTLQMKMAATEQWADPFMVDNSSFGQLSKEECSFEDNFSPVPTLPAPTSLNDPRFQSLQSKAYLAHLEAKLKKLKGEVCKKDACSRDILSSLDMVRIDASENMSRGDDVTFSEETVESQKNVEVNDLKRRMLPEQALTLEELTNLLERDYLNAVTQYIRNDPEEEQGSR